jgi:phage repressor protein C with HTH and peptisase S24 domain
MTNFDDIVERLKDIISEEIGSKKVFDKDVAMALGIEPVNFATMKKRNKIPFVELSEFCAKKRISLNWLLFDQAPESLVEATNKYYCVKYLRDISASAGGGAENYDENAELLTIPENFVTAMGGEKNLANIEAINVVGDSMEPTLSDRAIVFIDKSKTEIKKGGIFAIVSESGVFIKRLNQRIDGSVEIISDNRDYPVSIAKHSDFVVIGKAVSSFNSLY